MVDHAIRVGARLLLALRYRVRVRGLDAIARRGAGGILFLPNHPALVDPIIVLSTLHRRFKPRTLADRDQVNLPIVKQITQQIGVIPVPDIKVYGAKVRAEVDAAAQTCIDTLNSGGNVLFYPSGHIYRTRYENLRGNSGAHDILRAAPDARVVLVRTTGLWGSALSLASGEFPDLGGLVRQRAFDLLRSYVLFMPRRKVTLEFAEPRDLPRNGDRQAFNAYLEAFYNADAPPAVRVAYVFRETPREVELPEPSFESAAGASLVPQATREIIYAHLKATAGVEHLEDKQRLAEDLGLDSLARAELLLWLNREFGGIDVEGDAIRTVGDLLVAAAGESVSSRPTPLKKPPREWFARGRDARLTGPPGETLTQAFLSAAREQPDQVIVADQVSGARSYREVLLGVLALRPMVQQLPGDTVGIMLPASVGAAVAYWTALFSGKRPLMINWTAGLRNVQHMLELTGTQSILTAGPLLSKLDQQGVDLAPIAERFVKLEDLRRRLTRRGKLWAAVQSRFAWGALDRAVCPQHIAVLMTSGSESLPKAVPLTSKNVLTNIRDALDTIPLNDNDRLLAFLPPFHSFGLTMTTIMPMVARLRTVFHANPTEARTLSRLIEMYGASVMMGTPTFLNGILRVTPRPEALQSLRMVVTGAEKCPPAVYDALGKKCPQARVLEGYGITECSPVVSVNRFERPVRETIGKPLPSVEHAIVNAETAEPTERGATGMLLVRGPSIFDGYLGATSDPFVEHDGRKWYRTGDLVSEDDDGVLTFRGRLKRFVKIGGEMVSLPAIESALLERVEATEDDGPALAVVASSGDGRPEIVAFAATPLDRQTANDHLRSAGLSSLHNVGRVIRVDAIPLLGNGKTDHRALEARLAESAETGRNQ